MKYITVVGGGTAIALANYSSYVIMMLPNDVRCVSKHRNAAAFGDFIICCHKSTYAIIFTRITKPVYGKMSILFNFAVFEKFGDGEQRRFINMQNYKNFQKVKTRKESDNCPRHVQS